MNKQYCIKCGYMELTQTTSLLLKTCIFCRSLDSVIRRTEQKSANTNRDSCFYYGPKKPKYWFKARCDNHQCCHCADRAIEKYGW